MNKSRNGTGKHPGLPQPPLHPHLAAVWGAFLHEGMMLSARDTDRPSQVLNAWGNGYIELIRSVCEYIPILWQQMQPYWERAGGSGVFEYEVVSPLGEQLVAYMLAYDGNLPPNREFEEMARRLVEHFLGHEEAEREPARETHLSRTAGWRRIIGWVKRMAAKKHLDR